MSELEILAALSVDNVRAHVEYLTENLPTRLAGSENAAKAAAYNAEPPGRPVSRPRSTPCPP